MSAVLRYVTFFSGVMSVANLLLGLPTGPPDERPGARFRPRLAQGMASFAAHAARTRSLLFQRRTLRFSAAFAARRHVRAGPSLQSRFVRILGEDAR